MDPWNVLAPAIAVPLLALVAVPEMLFCGRLSAWVWSRLKRRELALDANSDKGYFTRASSIFLEKNYDERYISVRYCVKILPKLITLSGGVDRSGACVLSFICRDW